MPVKGFRYNAGIVLLCLLWYLLSASGNVLNKLILQEFPFPLTLATSSILTTSISSIPLARSVASADRKHQTALPFRKFLTMIVPLALGKLVAVSMSFFSLYKVPVSYAHTVKAMMPLFSVLCARLIVGEKQTNTVYLSLAPIVTGVIIASCSEMSFNFVGLISALCSTFSYALLNSYVKKVMHDTGLHHVHLLGRIAQTTCFLIFPLWIFHDVVNFNKVELKISWVFLICGLVLSGLLNFAQNVCTFSLINRLSVLSYAVANVTKRITVISISLLTLKNPVSFINICGMLTAAFGVLGYTQDLMDEIETEMLCRRVQQDAGYKRHIRKLCCFNSTEQLRRNDL
ncbi:solute carrier family 35 member E1 [Trichuris trichiura]|uniref:Solute carrier family 35 member E1 n=1 Tax=Trichuris trichiura TaxID=36087 RepID=A0A077ZED4_TRITR|nr:solute carrier family 35 member E1 [Trichuris trichiura]